MTHYVKAVSFSEKLKRGCERHSSTFMTQGNNARKAKLDGWCHMVKGNYIIWK